MRRWWGVAAVSGFALMGGAGDLEAQNGPSDSVGRAGARTARGALVIPAIDAVRVADDAIGIDGQADEPAWETAPLARDFVQFEPLEGAPSTERTEARVLYGDQALFVYLKA